MAQFKTYRCTKCGYEVQTEPKGHYALMSGAYYNFKCAKCKEIVALSAEQLAEQRYFIQCPECGKSDCLSTWNPIEGHCPKCGSQMKEDKNAFTIMAD